MCGIAGFVSADSAPATRETAVGRMCAAMRHRGPDDNGLVTRGDATIGGCRLAIFDPRNGHQPMSSPDGRWSIVFNGAIYNFKELRRQLTDWEFRTDCDTEVLLASLARWGVDCLPKLRGMFAFAAWDDQTGTLFLARDPFGIKPLYYRHEGGDLLFASELSALLASGVPAEIDPLAVTDYLAWFAVPAPRTIYRQIHSLRPGEYAIFKDAGLAVRPAWTFRSISRETTPVDGPEFARELRARLEDTIRAHVLADVPVGAFLSGGLDSAVIAGLMTRVTGGRLRTFSIAFDEPGYSEAQAAAESARHFGAEHHARVLTGAEVARDLDRLLGSFDQPTGDGINTYYASKAAREGGVTVALSGLGGDELFGGYPSFTDTPRLARLLPWWRRVAAPARRAIVARLRRGDTRRRKLADVLQHASSIQELGALQRRVFSEKSRGELVHPDLLGGAGPLVPFHPELSRLAPDLDGEAAFEVVSAWELRTYMADVLLRDSDVMSMRHSLELRVPFIDRPLIEWLWRQPARSTREPKAALYAAVADLVPASLSHRPKRGFTLPFAVWMKRELRPFLEDTFTPASIARTGLFTPEAVRDLWDGFLEHNDTREWSRVWSLAVLIAFANRRAAPAAQAIRPPAVEVTPATSARAGRTLLMAPEIFASEGGIPRILQLYLKALSANDEGRGMRLIALNDRPGDSTRALRELRGLETSRACARDKLRFVRESLKLARGCDTIVCGHIAQLPVAWLAKKLNPALRYHLVAHGIEVWRRFTAVERAALRGADRVLCVSDFTRRELLKNCPLPAGRAVVLHNALDPVFPIAAGRPLSQCPPRILVVTRITYADRYKGVEHMIEAMPAIRARIPDATLRIIGRGDDVQRLRGIASRLEGAEAVEFVGYVDDARLADEMRTCRLFALPSRKEGFGLVFLEAMAHGRPCLGATAGGIPEVITPATGMLVEYGDIAAIASAAVDALRGDWDENAILNRAREFSFASFRRRLSDFLTP